ncbi:class I SAM-dependent methyltransferase [Gymnodinialimonas sp.]
MTLTLQDPPLPSLARFRALRAYGAKETMLRRMELDLIRTLDLQGEVLDFGGGTTTNYAPHLAKTATYRSVNINEEFNPTDLVQVGDPIPFADAHFDAVITFNVLEHIYDDTASLHEVTRALKPGGTLHIIVPWMYPVHGHPDDFNRHTPSWWGTTLDGLGYEETTLLPLVFGRRTSALMIKGRGDKAIRGIVETGAALFDILEARARFAGKSNYAGRRGETVWSSAPGWYIRARKAP